MEAAWYVIGYLLLTVASWWLFRPSSAQQRSVEDALKPAPSDKPAPSTSTVVLSVNGVVHRVENPAPGVTLLTYLRETLGLTGAKIGCGEGGCGSCTVLEDETRSVNSCLRLLAACDGAVIRTVEGLGSSSQGYSKEQLAIADGNGSQCGYCTPGWVMAARGLKATADKSKQPLIAASLERALDGNICRCTGYRPILESLIKALDVEDCALGSRDVVASGCTDVRTGLPCGRACDKAAGTAAEAAAAGAAAAGAAAAGAAAGGAAWTGLACGRACDKAADDAHVPVRTVSEERNVEYFEPTTLAALFDAYDSTKRTRSFVGAATATIGVSKYYGDCLPGWTGGQPSNNTLLISTIKVRELLVVEKQDGGLYVGAAVTLTDLIDLLEEFPVAARHLRRVATTQVRNVATWAGNLALAAKAAAFPSDVLVALFSAGATLRISRRNRVVETVVLDEHFELKEGDLVLGVNLTSTQRAAYCDKVSSRHSNAHAIVNCGFAVTEDKGARLLFGGVLPKKWLRARRCETALGTFLLKGKTQAALTAVIAALRQDCASSENGDLAVAMLYKFLAGDSSFASSLAVDRPPSFGRQFVEGASNPLNAPASLPKPKLSARIQASGEALYTTDVPLVCGELHAAFAFAESAGFLTSVAIQDAKLLCREVLLASDLGRVSLDDEDDILLASVGDDVFVGARVAIVLAESRDAAIGAARKVTCVLTTQTPTPLMLLSNELEAALAGHFDVNGPHGGSKGPRLGLPRNLRVKEGAISCGEEAVDEGPRNGRVEDGAISCFYEQGEHEGAVSFGLQKHFHMETHAARCVPGEGTLSVESSAQDLTAVQRTIAKILNMSANTVVCSCRRAGGAFGGKISLNIAAAAAVAVAAKRTGKPVRLHADRAVDMIITGGREPTHATFAVSCDASGKMTSYKASISVESGCASVDAVGDLAMALAWSDNAYNSVKHDVKGRVLKTKAPRNSSMRSPGVLNSQLLREVAVERCSFESGRKIADVQEVNMYKTGDVTPYGVELGTPTFNYTLPELWRAARPKYDALLEGAQKFNATNRWRKRGVHLMPCKYNIGLSGYRTSCLVHVYSDGSVLLAISGSELGQGLFTKVAQVAAMALGCACDQIRVAKTSTATTANGNCTGGSGTSESCCVAAIDACAKIAERMTDGRWEERVAAATEAGVELSATGWSAHAYSDKPDYATYGTGLCQVEVDVLTGELEVSLMEVSLDQGCSLNSAIDVGQAEGAIIMSLGYFFTEQCADVKLGTWNYKPPTLSDVPLELNVTMLAKAPNPSQRAVLGSKASAEPPMQLAVAAFMAARHAIAAARLAGGLDDWFDLNVPLTPRDIRLACKTSDDQLTLDGLREQN